MASFERVRFLNQAPLYVGERLAVARGRYGYDGQPCIAKITLPGNTTGALARALEGQYRAALVLGDSICPKPLYFGPDGDRILFAYEDSGSETLLKDIERAPLPTAEAVRIAWAVAATAFRMHRKGWHHRAIRPNHVLIKPDGEALLIGLGSARQVSSRERDDYSPPARLECMAYLAPEQTGILDRPVDWRADLFSVAAILYALLTGRPPFAGAARQDILDRCADTPPPAAGSLRPGVPSFLDAIIAKAMAKDPDGRYATMPGFLADLYRAREGNTENAEAGAFDRPESFFSAWPGDPPGMAGALEAIERSFPGDETAQRAVFARVMAATGDGPPDTGAVLAGLAREGIASYDRDKGAWSFASTQAAGGAFIEVLRARLPRLLARLSEEELRFLECASVAGFEFDASIVCAILRHTGEIPEAVAGGLECGLITRVRSSGQRYRFAHQEVRSRLYEGIDPLQRSTWHNSFAVRFEEALRPELAVEHIRQDPLRPWRGADRIKRAHVFLEAAKTYTASNPAIALELTSKGIELAGERSWRDAYDTALGLHSAHCFYSAACGREDEFEESAAALRERAKKQDATAVSIVIIKSLAALGKSTAAVDEAVLALNSLGFHISANPGIIPFLAAFIPTHALLFLSSDESLGQNRPMEDKRASDAIDIIMAAFASIYINRPYLIAPLVSLGLGLCRSFGEHPEQASLLAAQGFLECAILGDYRLAGRYGAIAERLAERYAVAGRYSGAKFISAAFVTHWTRPLETTLEAILDSARLGKATGDREFSSHAYTTYIQYYLFSGASLFAVEDAMEEAESCVRSMNQEISILLMDMTRAFIEAMKSGGCARDTGFGPWPSWKAFQDRTAKSGLEAIACDIALYRVVMAYAGGRLEDARDALDIARPHTHSYAGQYSYAVLVLMEAFVSSREADPKRADTAAAAAAVRRLRKAARFLSRLERINPSVYKGKAAAARALLAFRQGRERASFDLFELALSHDIRAGQLFEEAAVATAYAFCLRGAGQIPLGAFQLHRAYDALCRWGAPPLAGELAERHPELATWIRPGSLSVAGGSPRFVDVNAIIQAGSELAGATSSDELVRRTLELLLKAGGATKARLWRRNGSSWRPAESMPPGQEEPSPDAFETAEEAAARGSAVTVEDERGARAFLPLMGASRAAAVVELGNDLVRGAFSADTMGAADAVAAQAGLLLEREEAYRELERQARERSALLENELKAVRSSEPEASQDNADEPPGRDG